MTLDPWLATAAVLLSWLLIPHVLLQRKAPAATLAWIWAILLFPLGGALVYLLIGTERVKRRSLAERSALRTERGRGDLATPHAADNSAFDPALREELRVFDRINDRPATAGNAVQALVDAEQFYHELRQAIDSAQRCVHLEFYIWRPDSTGRAALADLVRAAQRGVQVRLLVDEIGCLFTPHRFFRDLERAGGRVGYASTFSPRRGAFHLNLRNHRKLAVIDDTLAFVGGINIGDEYVKAGRWGAPWRDGHVAVRGPVVRQLAWLFAEDWLFGTGENLIHSLPRLDDASTHAPPNGTAVVQIVAGGPDTPIEEIQLSVLALLQSARRRVWITTPYFVPDRSILNALLLAAMRGVDVRLVLPAKNNHWYLQHVSHSFYEDLLQEGVRIFEFLPAMIHAKAMTVDEHWAMVGSANLDVRSLRINFELNLLVASPALARDLDKQFLVDVERSVEISLATFSERPVVPRLLEAALRPLAPLL